MRTDSRSFSRVSICGIAAAFLLSACGSGGSSTSGGMSQVTVRIGDGSSPAAPASSAPGAARRAGIPASVARIVFTVSGEGFETIVATHSVAAGESRVVETLSVPKGLRRTFLVEAYDAANRLRYRSLNVRDLLTDTITLSIAMNVATPNPGLDNWTLIANPPVFPPVGGYSDFYGMAFGNATFVAVDGSGEVWTSGTGAAWALSPGSPPNPYGYISFTDVAYGGNMFVAVSRQVENTNIFVSLDNGASWTDSETIWNDLLAVAYGNGVFVTVGQFGTVYHTDNVDAGWTQANVSYPGDLTDVAFGDGVFIAGGYDGVLRSVDGGANWNNVSPVPGDTLSLDQVVFANGVFLGLSNRGVTINGTDYVPTYFSTDGGATWTPGALLPYYSENQYTLTTGGGTVVILADYGDVFIPEGPLADRATTWRRLALGHYGLRCGTAGNGRYVIGGYGYVVLRSDEL